MTATGLPGDGLIRPRHGAGDRHCPLSHRAEAEPGAAAGGAQTLLRESAVCAPALTANRARPMRHRTTHRLNHAARTQAPAPVRRVPRDALAVLGAPVLWLALAPVLWALGAADDVIALTGLAALACTVAVSFALALGRGLRHGDWSDFDYCDCQRNDDDFDYTTQSGAYLDLKIQAGHEALMREADRYLENHDRSAPPH